MHAIRAASFFATESNWAGVPTLAEALERIAKPAFDDETIAQDFEYIATKLDISVEELRALHELPLRSYRDFKSAMPLIQLGTAVMRATGVQRAIIR